MNRDQYIEEAGLLAAHVMKLDVEGGDLELLRGVRGLFDQFRPVPISEALDETLRVWGDYGREIISTLNGPTVRGLKTAQMELRFLTRSATVLVRNQMAGPHEPHARMGVW
jgi:hypothetical protein